MCASVWGAELIVGTGLTSELLGRLRDVRGVFYLSCPQEALLPVIYVETLEPHCFASLPACALSSCSLSFPIGIHIQFLVASTVYAV